MKKGIAVLMVLVLVFSLTGCLSREEKAAVQSLMEMIDAIGTVTLDSEPAIEAAEEAYALLSDKAKERVENYSVLVAAREQLQAEFTANTDHVTGQLNKINDAVEAYDIVTAMQLIEDTLPKAEQLERSKYYTNEQSGVQVLTDMKDVLTKACYTNTHIITLDTYINLEDVYNATADSDEDEDPNRSTTDGMDYYTYFYNSARAMANAFTAYTDYLDLYFDTTDIESDGTSAKYFYADEQGRAFYVEWDYVYLGYYGSFYMITVGFDPAINVGGK